MKTSAARYYTCTPVALWAALVTVLALPSPASAWSFAAHRLLMLRAIEALPAELEPFFRRHRAELVLRVADPDIWRDAGWEDGPNHFLNLGVREYGMPPFAVLPREYGAAIERFGMATLRKNGLLPWRIAEEFGNLRRAFAGDRGAGPGPPDPGGIVLFAAVTAHYIQDAFQPLHATSNFDGAETGTRGLHARFEAELFARIESRLVVRVRPGFTPVANPRDAAFDALLAGHQLVDSIVAADRAAAGNRRAYDDRYFEQFFTRVRAMLQERLSEAATATAALVVGAWEEAGRPRL